VNDAVFYEAIRSFRGASKRLEPLALTDSTAVFKDFAHSPSKVQATVQAVKQQFGQRDLVACFELHTFSSLNADFLQEYRGSMDAADHALVYFNPKTVQHKKLPQLTEEQVRSAFSRTDLEVFIDSERLSRRLHALDWENRNLLLMSSGNFDGLNLDALAKGITRTS